MNYSNLIIERITHLCKERNISTNKLADLSYVRQSTISSILDHSVKNPRLDTLCKISKGLDMTISEFLDFQEMNDTFSK